jgi:hypothetical protein
MTFHSVTIIQHSSWTSRQTDLLGLDYG